MAITRNSNNNHDDKDIDKVINKPVKKVRGGKIHITLQEWMMTA
jgi:ABC-type microcin C transport system duplicated ATPase subunit YejF